jgi:hypothetical protein
MHYAINDTTITLTCTFSELCKMERCEERIYATPTPDGLATQLYISHGAWYRRDVLIATIEDFCEDEGWDPRGWAEMSEAEQEAAEAQCPPITITVPRRGRWTEDNA